ncbi:hypothetical protein K2Z84_21445 [Candidatus Binatia bacterium]|nr:hypothetical protein [Candidatus Binatia bacterium]
MGDRTFLWIECRPEDVEKVSDALWDGTSQADEVEEQPNGLVRLEDFDANYGLACERESLAKGGVPFVGGHGSGCEYGDALFAAVDGEHHDVPSTIDGVPVVGVLPDGSVCEGDLKAVRAYLDAYNRALRAMGVDPDTHERLTPAPAGEAVPA